MSVFISYYIILGVFFYFFIESNSENFTNWIYNLVLDSASLTDKPEDEIEEEWKKSMLAASSFNPILAVAIIIIGWLPIILLYSFARWAITKLLKMKKEIEEKKASLNFQSSDKELKKSIEELLKSLEK